MLGKTFKGLTDEMLAWQTQELYVQPKLAAGIACSEIQASPRYPSGLALRFARVKRYRPRTRRPKKSTRSRRETGGSAV